MGIVSNIRAELELSATELLEEYRGRLMAEAMRLCRDESAAEDLVMRTFERYFSRRPSYDPQRGSLLAWLRSVMRNLHTDSLRKRRVEEVLMSPDEIERVVDGQNAAVPDEDPEQKAREERLIVGAVDSLSPKLRAAVVLHYFECLPLMEVARSLCISENSVKQRLYYARKVLAKRLGKAFGRAPAIALGVILAGASLLYAAAVVTGIAPSPFAGTDPEPPATNHEPRITSHEPTMGTDPEPTDPSLSSQAPATNHESRTTNHETNGDSPQQVEEIIVNSNTNKEENTMNTQSVKSAAVKMLAAGAMLATTTFADDYQGARVRGRIFLPEGIYYYPIWDGFDGSTKTTGSTRWSISNQYAIYDVGRPMVMNTFGLLARSGYGARSKNYAWYGTNDKDDIATNGIANATFLFNTGTDITASGAAYTNFYSSASSEAFRYYCYAPRGSDEMNYHFMFFSEEAQIHQNLVHTLSADSVGGEEPSTIPFTGTVAYWPYATTPKIRVMVSPVEHEFNYNAWAADAQTRVFESAGTYSQGDNWSVDVANLPQGRWHARAFAVDGERTIAAHTSVAFTTGTKPYYPKAYYPTGIGVNAFKTYDSLVSAYAEVTGTQRIVFKLDDPRVEIVGFRIWGRTGNDGNWLVRAMSGRLRVTNDEGDMGEVTDYTDVTARSLHYAEKEPEGVTWTDCLRLQELDFYADRTEGYYAEYPVKIPIRNPTYICFDKFTYYQFREVEFRTLPRPTGSVYYIR